jgi:CheY-like chemotaxis protein
MTQVDDVEILFVEDNPADVELTLRALRKSNLANKVVVVNDGVEALDFLYARNAYAHRNAADRPRLILLDLKLPRLNGIEVARTIKADERLKTVPVVMLTSSSEERDIVESYRIGVNSYIVKPVEFDKFVSAVSDLGFYWMILNEVIDR